MKNLIILIAVSFASIASAEEWEYRFLPFLWAASQKGDVATLADTEPVEVDIEFDDILDNLDMAFMGVFEARKNRYAILSELIYLDLDTDEADTRGPFYDGAEYDAELTVLTVLGSHSYAVGSDTRLEALAGLRYWDADNTIKLNARLSPETSVSEQEQWGDLVIGAKTLTPLNPNWSLSASLLVGAAGDSDRHVDINVAAGYEFSETVRLLFGYRHLETDFEEGAFVYDVEVFGPTFGAVIEF